MPDVPWAEFLPDAARAAAATRQMSAELAASVDRIASALPSASQDPRSRDPGQGEGESLVFPVPPLAHAAYFDLLQAVLDDDVPVAIAGLDRFRGLSRAPPPRSIQCWGSFGDAERDLLLRHINDDDSTRVVFRPPSPEHCHCAREAVLAALALFDEAAPDLAAEIRAVVGHIILVSGTVNDGDAFDGATAHSVAGALFLNAERHGTRIAAIDGLAHESAHAVLFSRSFGRVFVENPDEERHPSPLRSDPRPLDGIFHATFVSARMHYAHRKVLASGSLDAVERSRSRERLLDSSRTFEDGRTTLRRHARLTSLGKALLDAAGLYMDHAATLD